jgi:hypothetical protein
MLLLEKVASYKKTLWMHQKIHRICFEDGKYMSYFAGNSYENICVTTAVSRSRI